MLSLVDNGDVPERPVRQFWPYYDLTFGTPNFVRYAESYGLKGTRVTSTAGLIPAIEAACQGGGGHVVAVPIDDTENHRVLLDELRARVPVKAAEIRLA